MATLHPMYKRFDVTYEAEKADALGTRPAAAEEANERDDRAAANQRHRNSVDDEQRPSGVVVE